MIRIGTRGSTLAMTQAGHVRDSLIEAGYEAELHIIHTPGDASQAANIPVTKVGVGVFTQTLRTALAAGECDMAIHSFKDLPTAPDERFRLAVPPRVNAHDVLISASGKTLAELPSGARVGTGAPRRIAQLAAFRSDLEIVPLRGNIDTRIGRTQDDLDAVILARAGVERVGRMDEVAETLSIDTMIPAPAQGALAVEVNAEAGDSAIRQLCLAAVEMINDPESFARAAAERGVLAELEAGCTAPIGAYADNGELVAGAFALDGSRAIRMSISGEPSEELGRELARRMRKEGVQELL